MLLTHQSACELPKRIIVTVVGLRARDVDGTLMVGDHHVDEIAIDVACRHEYAGAHLAHRKIGCEEKLPLVGIFHRTAFRTMRWILREGE